MDLALHHPDRAAQFLGARAASAGQSTGTPRGPARRIRAARLGLIFMDIHAVTPGEGRLGLTAEQIRRDLLAGIDQALHRADRLVEHRLSAALSSISTMRSTPLAPITTGTPT
jgi:hypothetical protein